MQPILIYLAVYALIGLAYGLYDDAVPYLHLRCALDGGITVRNALKLLSWLPLYALFGALVLVGHTLCALSDWVSKTPILDKQIIRCKRTD